MAKAKSRTTLKGDICSKATIADMNAITREVTKKVWSTRLRRLKMNAQITPIPAAKSQIGRGMMNEFIKA